MVEDWCPFTIVTGRLGELIYCSRGESVRFAYVTNLRITGKKSIYYVNQGHNRHRKWDSELQNTASEKKMFTVRTVYASLSATPPNPLIHLPFTSDGCRTHRFASTTACSFRTWLKSCTRFKRVIRFVDTLQRQNTIIHFVNPVPLWSLGFKEEDRNNVCYWSEYNLVDRMKLCSAKTDKMFFTLRGCKNTLLNQNQDVTKFKRDVRWSYVSITERHKCYT
jgi:hypothetical protein